MTIIKLARALADLSAEDYKQVLAFARELSGRKPGRKPKITRAKRTVRKTTIETASPRRKKVEPAAGVAGE